MGHLVSFLAALNINYELHQASQDSLELTLRSDNVRFDQLRILLTPSDLIHKDYRFFPPKPMASPPIRALKGSIRYGSNDFQLGSASILVQNFIIKKGYLKFLHGQTFSIEPSSVAQTLILTDTNIFNIYFNRLFGLFKSKKDLASSFPIDTSFPPFSSSYAVQKVKTIELVVLNDPARVAQMGEEEIEVSTLYLYTLVQSLFDEISFGDFKIKLKILAIIPLSKDEQKSGLPHLPDTILSQDPINPHYLLEELSSWVSSFTGFSFNIFSFFFQKRSPVSKIPWLMNFDHMQMLSGRSWEHNGQGEKTSKRKRISSSGDSVEGLAFVRGMCQSKFSTSIARAPGLDDKHGVSSSLISMRYQAQIIAHELGHALGASHDGVDNSCPVSGFVMQSSAISIGRPLALGWSPCSINSISEFLHHSDSQCLSVENVSGSSLCGNGIIDEGEECDSGNPNGSSCCTADCKLTAGSQCDDRNGRCCHNCLLKNKGELCRDISQVLERSFCDLADVCDGVSPTCLDQWKPEGSKCGTEDSNSFDHGNAGICESGVCFTRDAICKKLGMVYHPGCDQENDCLIHCLDSGSADIINSVGERRNLEFLDTIKEKISNFFLPFFTIGGRGNLAAERCITFALTSQTSNHYNSFKRREFVEVFHQVSAVTNEDPLMLPNGISCSISSSSSGSGKCYNGVCKSIQDYEIELKEEKTRKYQSFSYESGAKSGFRCMVTIALLFPLLIFV